MAKKAAAAPPVQTVAGIRISHPALRRVKIQEKTKVGEYLVADSLQAVV
jgi:hypothetical protein